MTASDSDSSNVQEIWTARIGLAVVLVLALASTIGAFSTLDIGTLSEPGEGMWVAGVSIAGAVLTVATLSTPAVLRSRASRFSADEVRSVALALPALALLLPMLELVGVILTVVLVTFYWMLVPHRQGVKKSLAASLVISGCIYVIFVVLLEVPFPSGSILNI